MPVNSNQKGKRGEREAAEYLRSIGFTSARRAQQYCGNAGTSDLHVDELPNVHIEVKFGYSKSCIDIGNKGLANAFKQSEEDADGKAFCVLWRPLRAGWRLTYGDTDCMLTAHTDASIKIVLNKLQNMASGVL